MKILAVSACPTGVAHTYMAKEALEKAANAKGFDIKVETHGAIGMENEITKVDIESADIVILAIEVEVPNLEKFEGKPVIKIPVASAIKNATKIMDTLEKKKENGEF